MQIKEKLKKNIIQIVSVITVLGIIFSIAPQRVLGGAVPTIESSTNISTGTVTTFNVDLPTDTVAGNLLVAIIAKDDDDAMASSHGFTKGFGIAESASNATYAWYKIADSADITRTYVTFTGDSEAYVGRMYRITGHNPDNPIYTADETGASGVSAVPQAPSINTIIDTLVFAVTGMDDNDTPYTLETGTWTSDLNTDNTTVGIVIARKTFTSAGATGAVDFTTNASDGWAASQISINGNFSPVTVLNTADETAFGADTTPTLEFTGTDTDDDDVEYNIQIDTVNTFDSDSTVIDSYDGSEDFAYNIFSIVSAVGQVFTARVDGTLTSCKFRLKKTSLSTGNAVSKIYNITGTYGTNAKPDGTAALATSDNFDVSGLTTDFTDATFTFSGGNQITLEQGSYYAIVVEYTGEGANPIYISTDDTSPAHDGNLTTYDSGVWYGINIDDVNFELNTVDVPPLDKLSETPDATFTNTTDGGDTHPFDSGDKADYTVQGGDALTTDTYYWRVRALDPSGTDTYGAWAATRSFTVDTSGAAPTVTHMIITFD